MRVVRRFMLAATVLASAFIAGCDPCSVACLLCLSSSSTPPPVQAQGSLVRSEAQVVLDHVVESASQRY